MRRYLGTVVMRRWLDMLYRVTLDQKVLDGLDLEDTSRRGS
jgi:hypothetical protein